jgi:hypothetical protein
VSARSVHAFLAYIARKFLGISRGRKPGDLILATGMANFDRVRKLATSEERALYVLLRISPLVIFLAAQTIASESWARESGQVDKWIFCLTTARLAEDQEIR